MESILGWLKQAAKNILPFSAFPIMATAVEVKEELAFKDFESDYQKILEETLLKVEQAKELQCKLKQILDLSRVFTSIFRNMDLDADVDVILDLAYLNQEFNDVFDMITDFHDEFRDMQFQLETFVSMLESHSHKVTEYYRDKKLAESKLMEVPTMDWVKDRGVPPVHLLVQDWQEMKLEKRMTENLALLRTLIPACPPA